MKIHTSNRKKVEEILNNTIISGPFWDYTLKYKLDETYSNYSDLVDDDVDDLSEVEKQELGISDNDRREDYYPIDDEDEGK